MMKKALRTTLAVLMCAALLLALVAWRRRCPRKHEGYQLERFQGFRQRHGDPGRNARLHGV